MTLYPRNLYLFQSNFRGQQKPVEREAVSLRSWHQVPNFKPKTLPQPLILKGLVVRRRFSLELRDAYLHSDAASQ